MRHWATFTVISIAIVVPGTAQAGTAAVTRSTGVTRVAQFTAERGEVNKLRVRVSGSGTTVLFIDIGGLPIDPGSGCEPYRAKVNEAICSLPARFTVAQALLGDRNDFADLDSLGRTQVNAAGENGDDNVIVGRRATRWSIGGGNGDDRLGAKGESALGSSLRGGAGNDTLTGSNASDFLIGDAGNDTLKGRGAKDRYSCGSGRDRAQVRASEGETAGSACEGKNLP
jgi:Ca2+-binding RTX toxin-like protein